MSGQLIAAARWDGERQAEAHGCKLRLSRCGTFVEAVFHSPVRGPYIAVPVVEDDSGIWMAAVGDLSPVGFCVRVRNWSGGAMMELPVSVVVYSMEAGDAE